MSGGSAVAMAYAIAHPERVSRLILYGTVCGEPVTWSPDEWAEEETYRSMIRVGWAKEDADFRRVFTTAVHPRCDRGADALVRRSAADVDVARQRRGQPGRPPAGRHRGRAAPDHDSDDRAPGDRRPVDDVRQRRERVVADPRRPPRPAPESQPHPPGGRAGLERYSSTRCRRSSSRSVEHMPSSRPTGDRRGAVGPRARRPPPGRRRPDQRRDRHRADPERSDGRAPPLERLREARR